ncbi:hypothetical protein KR018_008212, partial [Drosophila ironensis]
DYDMAQIGTCVQIYFDGISLVAKQLPNLVSDLKKCVNFQTIADLEKMNLGLFTLEAFSWVQSLANSMDCLWKMTDRYLLKLFVPGLVRSYSYSLPEIANCVHISLEAVSDITGKFMRHLRDFIKCVNLITAYNVESLDGPSLKKVITEFMQKLSSSPDCPMDMMDALKKLWKPHSARLQAYKCAYLGKNLNLVTASKCLDVALNFTSELTTKIYPLAGKLIQCVNYKPEINIRSLSPTQLIIMVFQFVKHLMKGNRTPCVLSAYLGLAVIVDPYRIKYEHFKCSYLFVTEPTC